MLSLGYGQYIPFDEIIAVVASESAPIKRMIQEARQNSKLIDATNRKRVRSIVITDTGHVILSAFTADSLSKRAEDYHSVPRAVYASATWIHPSHQ